MTAQDGLAAFRPVPVHPLDGSGALSVDQAVAVLDAGGAVTLAGLTITAPAGGGMTVARGERSQTFATLDDLEAALGRVHDSV